MSFFRKQVPLYSHFVVWGVVLLVVGALAAGVVAGILTPPWVVSAVGSHSTIKNEQVVTSIERKEQTVLLELGIEGISEAKGIPPEMLAAFPQLGKARYMVYSAKVKLGVDAVTVNSTGDHSFEVKVPPFGWIGVDDATIENVFSNDGLLSAFTEQDSEAEQFNAIFDDEVKQKYLVANQQPLRDQTEYYFTKLARSIDPDATLTFVFLD